MGLKDSFFLQDLDKTLATAGVVLVLIPIIGLVLKTAWVMPLFIGVLTPISCLLWLAIRKNYTIKVYVPDCLNQTRIWAVCFFGLYTMSVLTLYLRPELYERPLLYFILTAFMAGIISSEISTSGKRHTSFILIQVILLGVSVAWSQLLIFPGLLGVDPWYHCAFTDRIINEGFIPEGHVYSKLPLFHLIIAATSLITSLPYKLATMVSVSLAQIICNAVFVFLIANYLFKNRRIGLLAALMVIIANHHILMSYTSIPNAFAAIFIPVAIYLLLPKFRAVSRSKSVILHTMALAPIILTHIITAMCMAIILFIAWGALTFYQSCYSKVESFISLSVPVIFTIAMLIWWTCVSDSMEILVDHFRSGFSAEAIPEVLRSYAVIPPLEELLFNDLGMYLYFIVSLIAIFYMISRKGSGLTFTMAWVGMAPLVIGFFSFIPGCDVIVERWWYIAQILLSIPLAAAIYTIGTWKIRNPNPLYIFFFGFVAVLSFLLIMSPSANIDNRMFSPIIGSTCAYTQSETVASEFFAVSAVNKISSDFYYCTCPSSSIFRHVYGINSEQLLTLDDSLIMSRYNHDGSIKILRSRWYQESLKNGGFRFRIRPDLNTFISNSGFSKIYNNSAVTGYTG